MILVSCVLASDVLLAPVRLIPFNLFLEMCPPPSPLHIPFLLLQVHILLKDNTMPALASLRRAVSSQFRRGRLHPVLIFSSVDVAALPASVTNAPVLLLTPLSADDFTNILRETFALGDNWKPNDVLHAFLTDIAGPPRLLLGLLCLLDDRNVHLSTWVNFDAIQAKLRQFAADPGRDMMHLQTIHSQWLQRIASGFDQLNMGVVAGTMKALCEEAQLFL